MSFQLCAGRLPWDQNATKAMSSATRKSLDIRRLKPEINQELAEAIDTCLAQEAKDRYATLEHFLHAIRDVESEFDRPNDA